MREFVDLNKELMPKHVAIIMDGNGRWARARGKPRVWGHAAGADRIKAIVQTSGELGIKVVTLFAFSDENWSRPAPEVHAIMGLITKFLKAERANLMRDNVQFRFIGRRGNIPPRIVEMLIDTQAMTASNTGLVLNAAIGYGGRSDIVEAAKQLAKAAAAGLIAPDEIDARMLGGALATGDLPDPDLLIRTSGEHRVSNFLLWQIAYAEFVFVDEHWPEFTPEVYRRALAAYQNRERRFGSVAAFDQGTAPNSESYA